MNLEERSSRRALAAETERIEHGHENIRTKALEEVRKEIDSYRSVIVPTTMFKAKMEKIFAEFSATVNDLYAKINPALPVRASLEGYRMDVDLARKLVTERMGDLTLESSEKFEM